MKTANGRTSADLLPINHAELSDTDWSSTAAGDPRSWPPALATTVGILRHSPLPMILFWGPQALCFYNDAYTRLAPPERPAPGQPARWPQAAHLITAVLESGQPVKHTVPLTAAITGERLTLTYHFSAVPGPDGQPAGVLAVCTREADEAARNDNHLQALIRGIEENERKFRSLVKEAPAATAIYAGPDFLIEIANEPMIRLWGKTNAVIGMPLAQALPELEGQPFIGLLHEVRATGVAYSSTEQSADLFVEGRLQRFWFNFTYKPLFDRHGNVYAILNMATDITDQVNSRRRIEESETRLKQAIELAELATWSLDLDKKEISYSPRLQEWVGIDKKTFTIEGSPIIHERDQQRIAAAMQKAVSADGTGKVDETYTITHTVTGRERVIHAIGTVVYNDQGKPIAIEGTAQDITLQREMQQALENEVKLRTAQLMLANAELAMTNEQLRRSNEELSQYAYVASHDLQEPLRKIHFFSSVLFDTEDFPPALVKTVLKIQDSADRMSLLVNDLLEFSRLLQFDRLLAPVDLNAIVSSVVTDFELIIEEKGAQIHVGALPVISGVRLQMNQLFYNLVGNALKFVTPGRPPVIYISSRPATEEEVAAIESPMEGAAYHHIIVKDNGIGLDPDYSDSVFEIFRRLHGRSEYAGTGIGLSICRRVVQNHRGRIYVESAPSEGAAFHLLLPIEPNDQNLITN